MAEASGAVGVSALGSAPCWNGLWGGGAPEILIQRGETFNVTFRDLPSSLEPPYNVTEVIEYRNTSYVPSGPDASPFLAYRTVCSKAQNHAVIDKQWFEYNSSASVYNTTEDVSMLEPISYGFSLTQAIAPETNADGSPTTSVPFWVSGNYTTVKSSAAAPSRSVKASLIIFGLVSVALCVQ